MSHLLSIALQAGFVIVTGIAACWWALTVKERRDRHYIARVECTDTHWTGVCSCGLMVFSPTTMRLLMQRHAHHADMARRVAA